MPSEGLLSVVIPCYRSQAYLEKTVAELVAVLEPQGPFEIILVNDGSPDDVQEVIDRLHAKDARIRFLELGSNRGQHAATLKGFAIARGDAVITLDDDGQNPPEAGLAVARALRGGRHDVVYGRFQTTVQSLPRRLASRLNLWLFKHTMGNRTGVRVTNVRAIRGDLARRLGQAEQLFPYIDSMLFRATRRVGEVSVPHRRRDAGESTYRVRDLLRLWLSHMSTLTVLPLQLATWGSFFTSVFGLLLGVVQVLRALTLKQAPAGWLSLFCVLTFLFSLLFAFLGIISTYLGRMYVSLNARGQDWVRSSGGLGPSSSTGGDEHTSRSGSNRAA
ncbi:MAG TPA: glycosyltransferase family 2 protein [Archangium sp.]|nr:glycosyltransferase family 2 protein [Archangium sp.]